MSTKHIEALRKAFSLLERMPINEGYHDEIVETCDLILDALSANATRSSDAQDEPVAWIYEDELPEGYPYDLMYPHSKVDIVRMFPVFGPPGPTSADAKDRP